MKLTLRFDIDLYDAVMLDAETYNSLNSEINNRLKHLFERDALIGNVSNFEVLSWQD